MSLIQSLILGLVQGITEFLPVSSSGHLALAQNYLGFTKPPLLFDIFLHLGTLFAVLFVVDKKIISILKNPKSNKTLLINLTIATAITGVSGLLLYSTVNKAFINLKLVGLAFVVTGLWLFATHTAILNKLSKLTNRPLDKLPPEAGRWGKFVVQKSSIIGLAQSAALFPGLSRSGATISTGILAGLKPQDAFEFSFLLYVPAVIGALLLEMNKANFAIDESVLIPSALGLVVSFIIGFVALKLLKGLTEKGKLWYFSPYCILLGLLVLFL